MLRAAFKALCCALVGIPAASARPSVERTEPLLGFFTRYLDCGGIGVRSSEAVVDDALLKACEKITMMLGGIPETRARLIRAHTELHVIGRDERTSDLPEFHSQRDKVYIDNLGHATTIDLRTRGKGGGPTPSCGEENILRLPMDRYRGGNDTCIHEFAHTIMALGLTPEQRVRIQAQYRAAMAQGLWQNAYAGTNAAEYWAELSVWYFGFHGNRYAMRTPVPSGREALRDYDPGGYSLLAAIYRTP
jgi:alpha-glucosidase